MSKKSSSRILMKIVKGIGIALGAIFIVTFLAFSAYESIVSRIEEPVVAIVEKPTETFWSVRFFVDEFRQPTEDKYITNSSRVKGTFSNSAVTNRDLGVDFIISILKIDLSVKIAIKLYEYGRNHPVRSSLSKDYTILVQCKDGDRHTLSGYHSNDRLMIKKPERLHNILMNGGAVKFRITEEYGASYLFSIDNADGYKDVVAEF